MKNPPPPGAAPFALVPEVSTIEVPAATLLAAVAVQVSPAFAVAGAQLMIRLPADCGAVLVVEGVKLNNE